MDKEDPFYQIINEYIEDPGKLYFIWNMVDPSMLKQVVIRLNKEGVLLPRSILLCISEIKCRQKRCQAL